MSGRAALAGCVLAAILLFACSGTVEVTVDVVGNELVEHPLTEHLHSC